ncbi:hypothetical protein EG68_01774 [Paragonimus skrjabini miyazakii]|uniref:Prospero domain-containing protein n=1 Tax=Paragonimus skrjabini miyazakii TaxID=59628 RepID=A0A8S9Z0L9_9TREM|nr:hypothetical protein EG68_01774 [Paragonimus skrjabini miyazakii]
MESVVIIRDDTSGSYTKNSTTGTTSTNFQVDMKQCHAKASVSLLSSVDSKSLADVPLIGEKVTVSPTISPADESTQQEIGSNIIYQSTRESCWPSIDSKQFDTSMFTIDPNQENTSNSDRNVLNEFNRRKRRKPLAPPQRLAVSQLNCESYGGSPSESDVDSLEGTTLGVERKRYKLFRRSSSPPKSEVTVENDKKETGTDIPLPPRLHSNISENSQFIADLSRQTVEAVRQSICLNQTDSDSETDRFIEQTLVNLEPHIWRIMGQSLRSSIETVREQVMARLKRTMKEPEIRLTDTCSPESIKLEDNLGCKVTSHQSGTAQQMKLKRQKSNIAVDSDECKGEKLSDTMRNSSFLIGSLTQTTVQNEQESWTLKTSSSSKTHIVSDDVSFSSPQQLAAEKPSDISLFNNMSVMEEELSKQAPLSVNSSESEVALKDASKLNTNRPYYSSNCIGYSNSFSPSSATLFSKTHGQLDDELTGTISVDLSRGEQNKLQMMSNVDNYLIFGQITPEVVPISTALTTSLSRSDSAANALVSALGLPPSCLSNKANSYETTPISNLTPYPMFMPWTSTVNSITKNDTPVFPYSTVPLGLFPYMSPADLGTPLQSGFFENKPGFSMPKVTTNYPVEEQTEALALVVRKSPKDECGLFDPKQFSTLYNPAVCTATNGSQSSNSRAIIYNGLALSRRRRTKVTDTRLGPRGSCRMNTSCGSPHHTNQTSCFTEHTTAGLLNTYDDRKHPFSHGNMLGNDSLCRVIRQTAAEIDRNPPLLSPTEARMNSSSSSPSPNSFRLSNGVREPGTECELHCGLYDKPKVPPSLTPSNFPSSSGSIACKTTVSPFPVSARVLEGQVTKRFSPRQSEYETFEQVLAKAFKQTPQTFRQRTMVPIMNAMNDSLANGKHFPIPTGVPYFNHPRVPSGVSFSSQLLPTTDEFLCNRASSNSMERGSLIEGSTQPRNTFKSIAFSHCVTKLRNGLNQRMSISHNFDSGLQNERQNSSLLFCRKLSEFYYIQMEKYARVAISEGVRSADEIHVTTDSEIYRSLNLHYNRNQQLEVPDHFRVAVEATLREFFNALMSGKDVEQSWKKPIYKIIARMDQPVPEFFKNPNWMEQLADG